MKKEKIENEVKDPKQDKKVGASTFKTTEVVSLVLITCVVSLIMGVIISKPNSNQIEVASNEIQNFLKEYNYIVDSYYGEIDENKLLDAALKGVIDALGDPYSSSFDDDSSTQFNARLNGSYEGIGVSISNDKEKNIIISEVFDNSPAKKAGLKTNDIITSLNGTEIKETTTSEFINLVKEIEKATITLGITRGKEKLNIDVRREIVTLQSVTSRIIAKEKEKIGYINVSIFANNTDTQFKTELNKLEQEEIDSLIIDLRGNTGGHLTAVENMISMFLNKDKVIYQIEDKNKTTKYYSKGTVTKKYKIAILTDGGSASASEMMTAALKESYGAVVVGTKTFGKGTVQEMQNSQKDGLQYKITTKKWLTPKGNWVDGTGITPDIIAELSLDFLMNPIDENDMPLQKALEFLCK